MGTFVDSKITQLMSAVINFSASGDTIVIAAVAGQTIRVHRILFVVGGATSITVKDGTAALTGAMPMAANGGMVLDEQAEPWFVTTAGNAVKINSSNAVTVTGEIWYTQS